MVNPNKYDILFGLMEKERIGHHVKMLYMGVILLIIVKKQRKNCVIIVNVYITSYI